jgi:hypothetical protein
MQYQNEFKFDFSLVETNTTNVSPENHSAHKIVYTNTNVFVVNGYESIFYCIRKG